MAIKRADIYEHQNPNLPIVDAGNVAGSFLTVADVAERNNRPIAKRSRLINVLGLGLCLYTNASFNDVFWTNVSNWLNLTELLENKVDKETGKGLSQENFTTAEKTKLAGLEGSKFKGLYASLTALQTAIPTAEAGDFADVDEGIGNDVVRYIWDVTNTQWIAQLGESTAETSASIKTKYESNSDTNAFTDSEKTKLAGLGSYTTLTDKPDLSVYALISQLFSGNYNDLSNKPDLSIYAQLTQLFSGNYNDLTNLPDLTYLLRGLSDSFFMDTDKKLYSNITEHEQRIVFLDGDSRTITLDFEPIRFLGVFVNGVRLDSLDYTFSNSNKLEILGLENEDVVIIQYQFFVNTPS